MADKTSTNPDPQETGDTPSAEGMVRDPVVLNQDDLAAQIQRMFSSGWQQAKVGVLSQFPVIGPHGTPQSEAELLLSGKKPLGWIPVVPDVVEPFYPENRRLLAMEAKLDEAVKEGRLKAVDVSITYDRPGNTPFTSITRHYAQPGNEKDLETIAAYNQKIWNKEKPDVEPDKSFGDYLGYRKRDQMLFDNQGKLPRTLVQAIYEFSRNYAQPAFLEQQLGHPVDKILTTPEAARNGDPMQQWRLGAMYQYGIEGMPKDRARAFEWYSRAAEQGFAPAQYDLGRQYVVGDIVSRSAVDAQKWFGHAADQGYPIAMTALGKLYEEGNGIPQDDAKALDLFRRGAELGDAGAQAALGARYAAGRGVAQDNVEAGFWYKLAAKNNADLRAGGDLLTSLTAEQMQTVDSRVSAWTADHGTPKERLRAKLVSGAEPVELPMTPVTDAAPRAPLPPPIDNSMEQYFPGGRDPITLGLEVAANPIARRLLVNNSDGFLAGLDPLSKLRLVTALDKISSIPEGKALVDQFAQSGAALTLENGKRDTGGRFSPIYAVQPEGHVATLAARIAATGASGEGRLVAVLLHELEHFHQSQTRNLTPMSLGKIPSPEETLVHNRFIEADAQAAATDLAYQLKQKGLPEAWNALHDKADHREIAEAYEAAVKADPEAGGNGYAKRAAFDAWFTAKVTPDEKLSTYYDHIGVDFFPDEKLIENMSKNGAKPAPMTVEDYRRLGEQVSGVNYLDLPGAKPLDDPFYTSENPLSVTDAERLAKGREVYARVQEAAARGEKFIAAPGAAPPAYDPAKGLKPEPTPGTQAFDQFVRNYAKTREHLKRLPENIKIALDTPSALVTALPAVQKMRVDRALDALGSVPEGAALVEAAKSSNVPIKLVPDPIMRGGALSSMNGAKDTKVTATVNELKLQGYATDGALTVMMAHELQHLRQAQGGLRSSFQGQMRSPEEALRYERVMEADAEATATEVAYKLKLAGKPEAWKALQSGQVMPPEISTAYERMVTEDPASLNDGRAKRAAFDTWFTAKTKEGLTLPDVYNNQAFRNYPDVDHLEKMMNNGATVTPLTTDDLKKFGALSDVNYLDIPGSKPLDDPYYSRIDLTDAGQKNFLSSLRTRYNEIVAPNVAAESTGTVRLRHGTSEANLAAILDNGFQPRYRGAQEKVEGVLAGVMPEGSDLQATAARVLEKSDTVRHRAHEIGDLVYTTSDYRRAGSYAIAEAASGGEMASQILTAAGIKPTQKEFSDARPVLLTLEAPKDDLVLTGGETLRKLARGDVTVDSSHEVLLKATGDAKVIGVTFARKDNGLWTFEHQPMLTPEQAKAQIQPQYAEPRAATPGDPARRAILKEINDFATGPDVTATMHDATYVAETRVLDERGREQLVRVPDPGFVPLAEEKLGYFKGVPGHYTMPHGLTPIEVNAYLTTLDVREQRGQITAEEKSAKMTGLLDEMERVNPELKNVSIDRANPAKVSDAVHGVLNAIAPVDLDFHLKGGVRTAEYESLRGQTSGMGWDFAPETLQSVRTQIDQMTQDFTRRNAAAKAGPSLSNDDIAFVLDHQYAVRHVSSRGHMDTHLAGPGKGDAFPLTGMVEDIIDKLAQEGKVPKRGSISSAEMMAQHGDLIRPQVQQALDDVVKHNVEWDKGGAATHLMLVEGMSNSRADYGEGYTFGKSQRQDIEPGQIRASMGINAQDMTPIAGGASVESVLTGKLVDSIRGLRTGASGLVADVRQDDAGIKIGNGLLNPATAAPEFKEWSIGALQATITPPGPGAAEHLDELARKAIAANPVEALSTISTLIGSGNPNADGVKQMAGPWVDEAFAAMKDVDPSTRMSLADGLGKGLKAGDPIFERAQTEFSSAARALAATDPAAALTKVTFATDYLPEGDPRLAGNLKVYGEVFDTLHKADPARAVEMAQSQQQHMSPDSSFGQLLASKAAAPVVPATSTPVTPATTATTTSTTTATTGAATGTTTTPNTSAPTPPPKADTAAPVTPPPQTTEQNTPVQVTVAPKTPPEGTGGGSRFIAPNEKVTTEVRNRGVGGAGAGALGLVMSAQGLNQAVHSGDKLEMGIAGANLLTSTTQTAEGIAVAAGKTLPMLEGAGKFVPGLNIGITAVDGVYQISKEDTTEHKVQRGVVVAATTATALTVGTAAATVAEAGAITTGVTAVLGTGALATGTAAVVVAAAPVILTVAAVGTVAYAGEKAIEAVRAWEATEKAMADEAKPQKREGYKAADGKPSILGYKHIAVEMLRVSGDMKDGNMNGKPARDKNGRILIDEIRKLDMHDPKNIAELERAIDLNIRKQEEIKKANDSILPRWLRGSDSADRFTMAEMELGDLKGAKAEIAMYRQDLQAYNAAHPAAPTTTEPVRKGASAPKVSA